MKYGAHIFLWMECWDNSQLGMFSKAKKLGLDVIEIAVGEDVDFDAALVKKAAEDSGIELVVSPGGAWPMEADLSLEDTKQSKYAMNWHKYWIEKGAEAGATAYTGALYGHPGKIEKKAPSTTEFERVCTNLSELADYANERGVKIVLEPMSHFRTHFINTPEQALKVIQTVNHPNLQVLFDTYHVATEIRDYYKGISILENHLWGLHACENDRGCPGDGLIPWNCIYKGLKNIKFDGFVILETYNSSIRNGEFAFSRGMFHNVCPDGDAFVKQGIEFLKSKALEHKIG